MQLRAFDFQPAIYRPAARKCKALDPRARTWPGSVRSGAAAATGWDTWVEALPQWESSHKPLPPRDAAEDKRLASLVSAAAKSHKPKYARAHLGQVGPDLGNFLDNLPDNLPRDLHKRLEVIAKTQLAMYLGDETASTPEVLEYTTTDIAAALSVAGVTTQTKRGPQAVLSLVACETERQMTWSRLEGLISHWAVSAASGSRWELPPRTFKSVPGGSSNAGGAFDSKFEKHPLPEPAGAPASPTPSSMFTLLLAIPLEGTAANGGVVFVLKSGSEGQNTRWLKDAKTGKDFFIELPKP